MDRFPFSSVSILVHYGDHVTSLGLDDGTNSSDGDINNLMIVDALNIDLPAGAVNDANIVACDTAICAAINEGSPSCLPVARSIIARMFGRPGGVRGLFGTFSEAMIVSFQIIVSADVMEIGANGWSRSAFSGLPCLEDDRFVFVGYRVPGALG
jgi:hypothetical protein